MTEHLVPDERLVHAPHHLPRRCHVVRRDDDDPPAVGLQSLPAQQIALPLLCAALVVPPVVLDEDTELRIDEVATGQEPAAAVVDGDVAPGLRQAGEDEHESERRLTR
jgi:hypothetical protein